MAHDEFWDGYHLGEDGKWISSERYEWVADAWASKYVEKTTGEYFKDCSVKIDGFYRTFDSNGYYW